MSQLRHCDNFVLLTDLMGVFSSAEMYQRFEWRLIVLLSSSYIIFFKVPKMEIWLGKTV